MRTWLTVLLLLTLGPLAFGASPSPVGAAYREVLAGWPVPLYLGCNREGVRENGKQTQGNDPSRAQALALPSAFDSDGDRVNVPTPLVPDTSACSGLSLVLWFRIDKLDQAGFLAGFLRPEDEAKFVFAAQYAPEQGDVRAYVKYEQKAGGQRQVITRLPLSDGDWHLLGMTWDGTQLVLWLDGAVHIVACGEDALPKLVRATDFSVGGALGFPGLSLRGGADGIAVIKKPLRSCDLWALYDTRTVMRENVFRGERCDLPGLLPERGVCAHRGANASRPENTLAAFREAVRLGAHMIELDVYATADNRLAVLHDPTVDRTTNGSGKVADLTWPEIRKLDAGAWKNPFFSGERIPSLREVFAVVPANTWLNLHTKGDRKLGEAVAREVLACGREHQCFIAGGADVIAGARSAWPAATLCNMTNQGYDTRYVDDTLARGTQFIQFYLGMGSEADVQRLKQRNVRINYACANDPETVKRLFRAGVDFPLVDNLEGMIRVAGELGIRPLEPVWLPAENVCVPAVEKRTE